MSVTARISGIIPIPLTIFRNDTVVIPVTVLNTDGSTPYNLTGNTTTFSAKWAITDSSEAISLSSSDSSEISYTSPTTGALTLTFSSSTTSNLPVGYLELPYQLTITSPGGSILSALFGTIRVLPNITT